MICKLGASLVSATMCKTIWFIYAHMRLYILFGVCCPNRLRHRIQTSAVFFLTVRTKTIFTSCQTGMPDNCFMISHLSNFFTFDIVTSLVPSRMSGYLNIFQSPRDWPKICQWFGTFSSLLVGISGSEVSRSAGYLSHRNYNDDIK